MADKDLRGGGHCAICSPNRGWQANRRITVAAVAGRRHP